MFSFDDIVMNLICDFTHRSSSLLCCMCFLSVASSTSSVHESRFPLYVPPQVVKSEDKNNQIKPQYPGHVHDQVSTMSMLLAGGGMYMENYRLGWPERSHSDLFTEEMGRDQQFLGDKLQVSNPRSTPQMVRALRVLTAIVFTARVSLIGTGGLGEALKLMSLNTNVEWRSWRKPHEKVSNTKSQNADKTSCHTRRVLNSIPGGFGVLENTKSSTQPLRFPCVYETTWILSAHACDGTNAESKPPQAPHPEQKRMHTYHTSTMISKFPFT